METKSNTRIIATVILLFLVYFPNIIAQASPPQEQDETLIEFRRSFVLNDSLLDDSYIFERAGMRNPFITGLWTGLTGAAIGIGLTLIEIDKPTSYGPPPQLIIPLFTAGVGLLFGTVGGLIARYGIEDGEDFYIKKPFLHFGGVYSNSYLLGDHVDGQARSIAFGLSYRNLNQSYFLPNKLSIYYELNHDYIYSYTESKYRDSQLKVSENRIYLELTNISFEAPASIIYGLDFGVTSVKYRKHEPYGEEFPNKTTTLPVLGIIGGINLNLTSMVTLDLIYRHQLIGPYKRLQPSGTTLKNHVYKVSTSISFFIGKPQRFR